MQYFDVRSLATLPDGRQELVVRDGSSEVFVAGHATMRILLPDGMGLDDLHRLGVLRMELVPASRVIDL